MYCVGLTCICVNTWYKARLHGVNPDSVDTESTGERISPLVLTDEQSKRQMDNLQQQ